MIYIYNIFIMKSVDLFKYILFLFAVDSSIAYEIGNHPNIQLLPRDCGFINEDRILTDRPHLEEFPWLTLLVTVRKDKEGEVHFVCIGTLINSKYVLTSAYCIRYNNITAVRIGEYNIKTDPDCTGSDDELICAPPYQDISVEKATVHPEYNTSDNTNDIALLRLKESVNLKNSNVGVICLPTSHDLSIQDLAKFSGTVAGWKLREEPTHISKKRVKVLSDEDCKKVDRVHSRRVASQLNQLCAKGSQLLDIGSPLMIKGDYSDYKKYVQIGILSADLGNSVTGHYTDVTKYIKWILDTIHP